MSALLFALLLLACSTKTMEQGDAGMGGAGAAPTGDTSLFVPPDLPNSTINGEDTALTLIAFTLVNGANGAELYAAARNDGATPVCEPGMMTNFFDQSGALLSSAGTTLKAAQLYGLPDGTVIPCVAPGQIAMGGSTGLPAEVVLSELGHLEHAFPAFIVGDITPVTGLAVAELRPVTTLDGTAYTGTFTNGLDTPATQASVAVFPLNVAGRPLSMATASATDEVPAGGSWSFQTSAVPEAGVAEAVYSSN